MSRTLHAEDRISHYRILGLLGKGGMGEVYLALDETLERNVALKILPPRLVRSEERLRRFVQEAKAASSLNHPSIVTIYEIGRDSVMHGGAVSRSSTDPEAAIGGDDPEPSHSVDATPPSVHFISMELVSGETLAHKIHGEKADVRTLLGWLVQAAEGIAKAHAAGIVHRDLKPGNIMISGDGFAKVLDFGLAKLTEKQVPADEQVSKVTTEPRTKEGAILGTLGYMSPEQVQGKPVDHRSDIFSMGCILYEVATRRRPFAADTDVEVVHKILRERPSPIERLNPEVPAEVRRVAWRCLAKNPDQRQQSMKDLAMELREIVDEYESLSPSASSGGTISSGALGTLPGRRKRLLVGITAAAIAGVAVIGLGLYRFLGDRGGEVTQPRDLGDMRISVLLSHEDLDRATLSRDGRYLAYSTAAAGSHALHVRQIRTGSEVGILPPQETPILGVSFSPDGDYVYYLSQDSESPLYSVLFQVPSMGGTPRKVAFDVDTPVTFSPDGSLMAFKRGIPDEQADSIVVAASGTGEPRELIRIHAPESFSSAPDWSPDGLHIATTIHSFQGGSRTRLVLVDPERGAEERLGEKSWLSVDSLAWLPDGSGLVVSAFEIGTQGAQLYRVAFPGGEARRMTNDLNGYVGVTLAADGSSIAALRTSSIANLWVAPVGGGEAHPITFSSSNADSILLFEPLSAGEIAFTAMKEGGIYLWAMKQDGSDRRQITSQGTFVRWADYAPEAGIVFTQVAEAGIAHLWRVAPDGTGARQLTSGDGEGLHALAPDGSLALYGRADRPAELWALSLPTGESQVIASNLEGDPQFSPDGSRLLYPVLDEIEGKVYPRCVIVPAEGGKPVASLLLPPGAVDLEWAPSGTALTFIDSSRGWNVFRIPIDGGEPTAITTLTEGRIIDHEWSPDGRRLSAVRDEEGRSGLWVQEAGAEEAVPLTEFKTGEISGQAWARDSASVVFRYGTSSRDVVIIRDFQ